MAIALPDACMDAAVGSLMLSSAINDIVALEVPELPLVTVDKSSVNWLVVPLT